MTEKRIEELFDCAKSGDKEAASELIGLLYPQMFRTAMVFTADEDSAKDIVQEAGIKLLHNLPNVRSASLIQEYAKHLAHNCALDMVWNNKRHRTDGAYEELLETAGCDENPETLLMEKEKSKLILNIIASLPKEQAEVLILRFYEEKSLHEISEELGIPESAVTGRLFRARQAVRKAVIEAEATTGIALL